MKKNKKQNPQLSIRQTLARFPWQAAAVNQGAAPVHRDGLES